MKTVFYLMFFLLIAVFAVIVLSKTVKRHARYLEDDIRRNGEHLQTMIEDVHTRTGAYPENLYTLFSAGAVNEELGLVNPYTSQRFVLDADRPIATPYSAGNFLYVVASRDKDHRPESYRLYMLGRTSDRFYNAEKAYEWREEYMTFTKGLSGPDNIVMVFSSPAEESDN